MMGSLAREDVYDPMTGIPIGVSQTADPALPPPPSFAMGALAAHNAYTPFTGDIATGTTPWKRADIASARAAEPRSPIDLDPATNKWLGQQAQDFLVPTEPWEMGLAAMGPAGRIAGKVGKTAAAMAGVYGQGVDEAEAARWVKHPFNAIAVGDTIENLAKRNLFTPTKTIAEQQINPHDIPVGSWLTPLVGDRSASGGLVTHIGDKELRQGVPMQGGYQYSPEWLREKIGWASDKSAASTIAGRARDLQREAPGNVYGVYTAMSPQAIDASHHISDAISQVMQHDKKNISKTATEKFDTTIRKVEPDFPGVKSPELQDYLRGQSMTFRNYVAKEMNKKGARDEGFPDIEQIRIATTHPALRDVPNYSGGQSISRLTGDVLHEPTLAPHYTYRSKLPGEYMGGLAAALPQELLWRDFAPLVAARNPSAVGKIWLTGLRGEGGEQMMKQRVDPQWQDAAAEYLRRNPMGALAAP